MKMIQWFPLQSYQQREAFIATQAPLEHTCVDFWRMIWEYESYTVVMLTMPFESNEVRYLSGGRVRVF